MKKVTAAAAEAALRAICDQDGIDYEQLKNFEREEYQDWLGWLQKPLESAINAGDS